MLAAFLYEVSRLISGAYFLVLAYKCLASRVRYWKRLVGRLKRDLFDELDFGDENEYHETDDEFEVEFEVRDDENDIDNDDPFQNWIDERRFVFDCLQLIIDLSVGVR